MRVTYLSASGAIGGAERVLLDCVRATPWTAASLLTLGTGPLVDEAARLGVRTRAIDLPDALEGAGDAFGPADVLRDAIPILRGFPPFFSGFSQALSSTEPDVIHSHGIKTHVLAAMIQKRASVVWHLHDYVASRAVSSRLLRLLAPRCDLAVAVSDSVAADARRVLPSSLPIVVVRNGVDTKRFTPDGAALDLDARSGLGPAAAATVRVVLPATFARWKGHDVFLDAIARLDRAVVRAYVVGGPVYQTRNSQWSLDELRERADRLGIAGRVGFTGSVDDMPAAYRAADVVVHASTRPEPFGLVIAEAMACGRALVASPRGGAGELFTDGVHAVASAGGDASSLASALDRLISDPHRRQSLGRAARVHAVATLGHDRFATGLKGALSRIEAHARALEAV